MNCAKMFAMKLIKAAPILAAVFFNLIISAFPKSYALASSEYKYAYVDLDSKVYFCTRQDEDYALFEIPQTYCLEILSEDDGWLEVKYAEDDGVYQALYGYCKIDGLILSNEEPKVKYLKEVVTVTYRTEDVGNMLDSLPPIEYEAAYYGALTMVSKRYSYVYSNGYFGYITGAIENYPLNSLPNTSTFSPSDGESQNGSSTTLITAVAVTAVAVIAIAVLYFSSKTPPKNSL